jgi:phage terminase large subunit-like protein
MDAGATERLRLLLSANRIGKTLGCGGFETVCHMTGVYPHWWRGYRFRPDEPVPSWICGTTAKNVREIVQLKLLGPAARHGTGLIPKQYLGRITAKSGVPDAVDTFQVKHVPSGGWSPGAFKSYDQGREAFEGSEQKWILLDEEPPLEILSECMIRVMTTSGRVVMPFTPKKGLTPLIKHCRQSGVHETNITWADNPPHLTEEDKTEILRLTPEYLRDAVSRGVPLLGSGAVFTQPMEQIKFKLFAIPPHFKRIAGMDIGWDHPTAVVWLAYDPVTHVCYLYDAYRVRITPIPVVADAIKARGVWIPIAWPADAEQHAPGTGIQVAPIYRTQGLNMLPEHATWEKTGDDTRTSSMSVEAGIELLRQLMLTNQFKVAEHLTDWWEEYSNYHREEGKLVKVMDDLLSATRYALMMLHRYGIVEPRGDARGITMRGWRR